MDNVLKIDKLEYRAADEIILSEERKRQNFKRHLIVQFNVFCLIIFEVVLWLKRLFVPLKPKNIAGQLCLVTGGANGLGRFLALRFAKEGCNVAICDIVNFDDTVKEIADKYKVKCQGFTCDVSDNDSILRLKADVEAKMGATVDILVNNAGLLLSAPLLNTSLENIQRCVDVNLVSHFKMVRTFLPGMMERKYGRIVAISSISALVTLPMATVYSSTKFGVNGFMQALFDDLCIDNCDKFIRLSTVFPYFINTRKELADLMDEVDDFMPRMTPQFVAEKTVEGVLLDQRRIVVAPPMFSTSIQNLPDRIIKYVKTATTDLSSVKRNRFN